MSSPPSHRHVALLRGINVGGKNRLPMKELVADFLSAGASEVQTYIQSGNVLFDAPKGAVAAILDEVSARLAKRDLQVPLISRTATEFNKAVAAQPFGDVSSEALHLGFLSGKPRAALVRKLDPERSPGDQFKVVGREVYLLCPNGLARTKLTSAFFDRGLEQVLTVRNWKTTLKLQALLNN